MPKFRIQRRDIVEHCVFEIVEAADINAALAGEGMFITEVSDDAGDVQDSEIIDATPVP